MPTLPFNRHVSSFDWKLVVSDKNGQQPETEWIIGHPRQMD